MARAYLLFFAAAAFPATCISSRQASSLDSIDIIKEFDNFNYIISKGSVVRKVKNHYPNFKNPVNTTILTGEPPEKHGIYFNNYNDKILEFLLSKISIAKIDEKLSASGCIPILNTFKYLNIFLSI